MARDRTNPRPRDRFLLPALELEAKCKAIKFTSVAGCKAVAGCDGNDGLSGGWYKTCHAASNGIVKSRRDCPNGPFCKAAAALSDACAKGCGAVDAKYGNICSSARYTCYAGVRNLLTPGGARWVLDNRPDLVAGSRYFALYASAIGGCQGKMSWVGGKSTCSNIKLDTAKLLSGKVPSPSPSPSPKPAPKPSPKPAPTPAPTIAKFKQCGGKGGGCGGARPCSDAAWTSVKCVAGLSCRRTNEWHWQCE